MNVNQYLKAIVAAIGAIGLGLQTAYPSAKWEPTVIAGITALLVYLTPNAPKTTETVSAPPKPVT